MLNRRQLLAGGAAGAVAGAFALPGLAAAQALSGIKTASIRGSINASEYGVRPGALDDQSRDFARMLEKAASDNNPVFLPPGVYRISNIVLPKRIHLSGIPGETHIVYGGGGFCLKGENAEQIALSGLTIDGANRWLSDDIQAVLDLRGVETVSLDKCTIIGSGRYGVAMERSGGSVERSSISGAAEAGIYSVEATGMRIADNTVTDCGNGGILVHRWDTAEDATIVSGNRVTRIGATAGGTGQNGNGINVFRADNVMVANNRVADCAFSAIRANSGSDVQITGNNCSRSGETAIYSEFSFEGAVISANVVDGAANGISMVNFDEGGRMAACTGNIIRNLSTKGPYKADPPGFGVGINVEADSSVTGNVIEDAPTWGMGIGWGRFMRNVVATGNVVRNAGTGIAVSVVEGTGSAVITDNVFSDTPHGAVVGYRWAAPATGDLAISGARSLPRLTVERNQVA